MCRGHPPPACQHILFIREGRRNTSTTPGAPSRIVPTTQDWRMRVNLSRKLQFPQGDHHHKPLPRHSDMVQWHQDQTRHRTNCPMGGRSRICLRQEEAEVFTECNGAWWRTIIYPVETGCCSCVGISAVLHLRGMRVTGANQWNALKDLAEEKEQD